jgi:CelD/BcsL family acetyltransferase involved in cellulose biosynthesis
MVSSVSLEKRILDETSLRADSVVPVDLELLSKLEPEWRALEGHAVSFCQCYDYARVALSIAQELGRLSFLITVRDGIVLRGVWGLTLTRSFHSVLRPFSCGTNEEYSWPIIDSPSIASRIFQQAATLSGAADRLMIYNLAEGSPLDSAAGKLPFPQTSDPIKGVAISSSRYKTWPTVEKALPKGLRYDLRTGLKRLSEKGTVTIGWTDRADDADKVLAFFFERKAAWLAEKRKRSLWITKTEVPEFFKRLVRATNRPIVASVQLNGVPIAAAICLVGPVAVEFFMTTFDPSYAAYSPGKLLIRFLVQWAIERDLDFDFRITLADYKKRWPVEARDYNTRTVMLTTRGRIPDPKAIINRIRLLIGATRRWIMSFHRRPNAN